MEAITRRFAPKLAAAILCLILAPLALHIHWLQAAELPAALAPIRKIADDYAATLVQKRASSNEEPWAALQKSKAAGDTGNWTDAVHQLEIAAGGKPHTFPVMIRLGRAWQKIGGGDKRGQAAALLAYSHALTDDERLEALTLLDSLVRSEADGIRIRIDNDTKRLDALLEKIKKDGDAEQAATLKVRQLINRSRLDYALQYGRIVDANKAIVTIVTRILGRPSKVAETLAPHNVNAFYVLGNPRAGQAANVQGEEPAPADGGVKAGSADGDQEEVKSEQSSAPITWSTNDRTLRACARFTMSLRPSAAFYKSRYVEVLEQRQGSAKVAVPFNLNVRGNEICFIGLKHDVSYVFVFKRGMPDQTGFALTENQDIPSSAPKAPSIVRFDSRAYVMPANASSHISFTALRAPFVRLSLYRVGERGIHREAASGVIGTNFLSDAPDFKENRGEKLWSGLLDLSSASKASGSIPFSSILDARSRWIRSLEELVRPAVEKGGEARIDGTFADGRFYGSQGGFQAPDTPPDEAGLFVLVTERLPDFNKTDEVERYKDLDNGDTPPASTEAKDDKKSEAVQWIIVTDIGLSYYRGSRNVHVVARSLKTAEALPDTEIRLISAANRVLASAKTNAMGVAEFPVGLTRGQRGNRLASIVASREGSLSIIDPKRDIFDLSAHGLYGALPAKTADAFVYTDRGLYRPGEVINAVVLVRSLDGKQVSGGLPLRITLRGARGEALSDVVQLKPEDLSMGGVALKLPIARTAVLGAADVTVAVGETIVGRAAVQIAHFQPDRARIQLLAPAEKQAESGVGIHVSGAAQANYLYGGRTKGLYVEAPASHLMGEAQLLVSSTSSPFDGCYDGYAFGVSEQSFAPFMTRHSVGPTGADGRLGYELALTDMPRTNLPLKANVSLSLFDVAGRIGSRTQQFVLKRSTNWLGVGVVARDTSPTRGMMRAKFNVLALDAQNNARQPGTVSIEIQREVLRYYWYEKAGKWGFVTNTEKVSERTITADALPASNSSRSCNDDTHRVEIDLPVGNYAVVIRDSEGTQTTSRFVVGASSTSARALPEVLPIRGYRNEYRVGDTIDLKVDGQFDGHLLAAVVRGDEIVDWISVSAPRGQAELAVPVPRAWSGAQLHIVATLFRANTDGSLQQGPARAVGVHRVRIAEAKEKFDVRFEGTPHKLASGAGLPVRISLRNDDGTPYNGTAMVGLFAVDEGILNLTDHKAPDPIAHFLGPRRMSLDVLDNYGRLLLHDAIRKSSGGDDVTGFLSRVLGENVRPDRLFSRVHFEPTGVLFEDGVARINPSWGNFANFDGSIRLAAIVWTSGAVGATTFPVLIRNALVANLGLPRYVAPGDKLKVPLVLENLEAVEGTYAVRLSGPHIAYITDAAGKGVIGPDADSFDVDLQRGIRRLFWAHLVVPREASVGQLKYELKWQLSDNKLTLSENSKVFSVNIHEPSPPTIQLVGTRRLNPGQALALSPDLLPASLARRPGATRVQVRFGPTPTLLAATSRFVPPPDVIGSLESLVWTAMSLLVRQDGSGVEEVNLIVQDLISLQNAGGGFAEFRPLYSDAEKLRTAEPDAKPAHSEKDASPEALSREIWRTALVADLLANHRTRGSDVEFRLSRAQTMLHKTLQASISEDQAARSAKSCTVPYLYAAIVLAGTKRVTDDDLKRQWELCPADAVGPLEGAMIAAAAAAFGRIDAANVHLTSLKGRSLVDAQSKAEQSPQQRSAMLIAFLARARAPDSLIETALASLIERGQDTEELSAAAMAWLAQSSMVGRNQRPKDMGNVKIDITSDQATAPDIVESRGDEEVTTKFVSLQATANHSIVAINRSDGPVVATIFARGSRGPERGPRAENISVERTFFDDMGRRIDSARTTLQQNKLYYVQLEGQVKGSGGGGDQEPTEIVVNDYLAAGFEVAAKALLPGTSAINPARAALGEDIGRVHYAEALDDRFVAILTPAKDKANNGRFRLLYAIRPTLLGDLHLPVSSVEEMRKPETSFTTQAGTVVTVQSPP